MLAQAQRPQQAAPATAPKLASPASARQRKDAPAPRLPNPLGASIRRWWQAMGRGAYPGARQLLIRARSRTFCTTLRNAEEVDARRPRPTDKRVWASVEKSARKVICEAFEEAQRRDPERRRRWVVLVDGEPKQLRAVKAEVRRLRVDVTIILDVVHVIEYVWNAARALFGGSNAEAEKWVADRLSALLTDRSGGDVARTIRWWAARAKKLSPEQKAAIDEACDYLADRTRTRLMHYEQALRDGLPIATGVIEGACRYLVKDRMDRTGARWSLTGAEAVLRLRALRASGDFDAYWPFHLERDKERNHASRYEGAKIPDPLPPPPRRLRRVK